MRPDYRILIVNGFNKFREGVFKQEIIGQRDPYRTVTMLEGAASRRDTIIVFDGGADVTPALYGMPDVNCHGLDIHRDMHEVFVWQMVKALDLPFFGFCRGHQFIGAMSGATLIQDIRIELGINHGGATHGVKLTEEFDGHPVYKTLFEQSPFGPWRVSSTHHQAVATVPPGAKWIAVDDATGKVCEMIEYENGLTMQCHPEFMDWRAPLDLVAERCLA